MTGLALVGLAVTPAFAPAAPPWLAPETVSAPGERAEHMPLMEVAPSGDAVAAWVSRRRGLAVVRAATRAARGSWEPPEDLSPSIDARAVTVQAAIDRQGDAVVAWQGVDGPIQVAVRPGATGAWLPPEAIVGAQPVLTGLVGLAIEPSGTVVAVWHRDGVLQAVTRPAATGAWPAPRVLSPPGERAGAARLSASAAGAVAVQWLALPGPRLAVRPPGGEFAEPETPPGVAPVLAIGPDGELVAVQTEDDPGLRPQRIEASVRPPGGMFTSLEPLATVTGGNQVRGPDLGMDAAGNALAAWHESGQGVVAVDRPAGGDWGVPASVSPPELVLAKLAVGSSGAAVILLHRRQPNGGRSAFDAVVRTGPGRPFGAPERVTPFQRTSVAVPAIDDHGVAAVLYVDDGSVRSVLRARGIPGEVALTAAQLRVNQRISQAAVRRANAIEARLSEGLTSADVRPGALRAAAFAAGVEVAGEETGAFTPPGPTRPLVVPPARRGDASAVRLTAAQLLINQRISQAAVRRANRLTARFDGGLTGAHVAVGAIGPEHLAPGLSIAGAAGGPAPAAPAPEPAGRRGERGRVTLSAAQLRINQRISQAAVRRLNSLVAQLERGLPGSSFAPGSITAADLAPEMRT